MKLKALIVDDEKNSRESLQSYLERYCEQVEIAGQAANVQEAGEMIRKHRPNLVFLDIEMPFGNGFDLLAQWGNENFQTIFVTAFSEYALKAIQVSASSYLLKPVDIEELVAAVKKAATAIESKAEQVSTRILIENSGLANRQLHKIVLPTMEGFEVVQIKDIAWCEAQDNFTLFHLADKSRRLICRNLRFYENLLTDFQFIRIHKSYLINRHYVSRYLKGKGGTVVLTTGDQLDVSVNRKEEFLGKFR